MRVKLPWRHLSRKLLDTPTKSFAKKYEKKKKKKEKKKKKKKKQTEKHNKNT